MPGRVVGHAASHCNLLQRVLKFRLDHACVLAGSWVLDALNHNTPVHPAVEIPLVQGQQFLRQIQLLAPELCRHLGTQKDVALFECPKAVVPQPVALGPALKQRQLKQQFVLQ